MTPTIEQVRDFIATTPKTYRVYIGCDSKNSRDTTLFVTAVVIHYVDESGITHGARAFAFRDLVPRIRSMTQRLGQEVFYAINIAEQIKDVVAPRLLEIHLDYHASEEHKSNKVVSQSIGVLKGMDYNYQLKPHAHAASSAADFVGRFSNFRGRRKRSRKER